eukprot:NODE_434_length_8679_cov_0.241142.p7 type:complete len:146 gc:universal NODE_434_length_8679_cov_0.241142:1502-1939(+)
MLTVLIALVLGASTIRIVNPTTSSTWTPNQDVYVVWEVVNSGNDKLTFNLMDGSQGNNDAPLIKVIADNVNPNAKKLSYKVPGDVNSGKYFIQVVPNDGKPQYSSTFQIGESTESTSGDPAKAQTSSSQSYYPYSSLFLFGFVAS